MNEIDEKDLENAAGGVDYSDEGTVHDGGFTCDKFERNSSAKIPINCCTSCIHGKVKSLWGNRYYCNIWVE